MRKVEEFYDFSPLPPGCTPIWISIRQRRRMAENDVRRRDEKSSGRWAAASDVGFYIVPFHKDFRFILPDGK